jgi:hypothetical protein
MLRRHIEWIQGMKRARPVRDAPWLWQMLKQQRDVAGGSRHAVASMYR